jgi:hypothetical protein
MSQSSHNTTTTAPRPLNTQINVDELIKKSEGLTKIDDIRKQTQIFKESINRYKTETLSIQRHSENILGRNIETYDVEIQTENIAQSYSSDEENNKQTDKEAHRRSVATSAKAKLYPQSSKKGFDIEEMKIEKFEEKDSHKKIIINDDYRRQVMNSTELSDFLIRNSKYVERVNFF